MLLENLEDPAAYVPIDVAKQQLAECAARMNQRYPDLEVKPVCADFTNDYELPTVEGRVRRHVVFFPGSTVGNFTPTDADISSGYVCVGANMFAKLGHKTLAKTHNFVVTFTLGVKIRTTLTSTHR